MSSEKVTHEIKEYADICRGIVVSIYNRNIATGDYDEKKAQNMEHALSQYWLSLEIMKLEKEL
nr:MAG TPA: hypothetical protein [Caudoviricetes sp.]